MNLIDPTKGFFCVAISFACENLMQKNAEVVNKNCLEDPSESWMKLYSFIDALDENSGFYYDKILGKLPEFCEKFGGKGGGGNSANETTSHEAPVTDPIQEVELNHPATNSNFIYGISNDPERVYCNPNCLTLRESQSYSVASSGPAEMASLVWTKTLAFLLPVGKIFDGTYIVADILSAGARIFLIRFN